MRRRFAPRCAAGSTSTSPASSRALRSVSGPADEDNWDLRVEWERLLGADRWVGLVVARGVRRPRRRTSPTRSSSTRSTRRSTAPARISFFGEGLFAPTLIQFGTDEQKRRFLPQIQAVEELWCQGFSEPNAGSDLANIQTRAVLDGDEWVVTGQKVWTTLAHRADWCFVVCRTDPESTSHRGLSYLLVPMHQDGIEVRPLRQMTGSAEFNEVFFDGARTAKENVLGPVGEGWKRRDGDARLRTRHRVPEPAARVRARARAICSTSRTRTAPRTTP